MLADIQKVTRYTALLTPEVDFSALDMEKDVHNGVVVNEDVVPFLKVEPVDV